MLEKTINENIAALQSMHQIVETYEEIAAMRTRKIKNSVLQNREFIAGLNSVFQRVEHSYKVEVSKFKNIKAAADAKASVTNGRTVYVLISSNTGLYGDIVKKVFYTFVSDIKDKDVDLVITGISGRTMFDELSSDRVYTYFDLSDTIYEDRLVKKIFDFLVNYETIVVYHGIFKDMLSQNPTKSYITRGSLETAQQETEVGVASIFEPSLHDIVRFFETQILASLFDQSVYESNLSKYASRMISLDLSASNIAKSVKKTKLFAKKFKHHRDNERQLSSLSGVSLWGA